MANSDSDGDVQVGEGGADGYDRGNTAGIVAALNHLMKVILSYYC